MKLTAALSRLGAAASLIVKYKHLDKRDRTLDEVMNLNNNSIDQLNGGETMAINSRPFKTAVYAELARLGKALSSPLRVELLDLLSNGPKSVERLARETQQSVANVSQHLQTLLECRLVKFEKRGNLSIYQLSDPKVEDLIMQFQTVGEWLYSDIARLRDEWTTALEAQDVMDLGELTSLIDDPHVVVVVDVRSRDEYEYDHIPGALSIPIEELESKISELPRDKRIVVYCRGHYCLYASEAVKLLRSHGFDVVRLDEGVREWRRFVHAT